VPRIRLIIEYDGSGFSGWQYQPGCRTIQEELTKALRLLVREELPLVQSSGRTDAGVHARGQVVAFSTQHEVDLYRLAHGVSSILRGEVAIRRAEYVPESFHPRQKVICKQYSYRLLTRPAPPTLDYGKVWHVAVPLDLELLESELQMVVGHYDFSSYRAGGCQAKSPVKEISSITVSRGDEVQIISVQGRGFLKQMIRILVGTAVDRSRGKITELTMAEILEKRDRMYAGVTAPPGGLCLDWVKYE
jgi:tRNA pseudouridine38-40 synthase